MYDCECGNVLERISTHVVVPTICGPLVGQHITTCFENTQQFMGLDFADYSDGRSSLEVDVLIGSDYYWDLVTGSVYRSEGGPTAIHTKLGWVLSGPTPAKDQAQCSMNLTTTHVLRAETQELESTALDEQLRSFWELESLGINKEEKTLYDEFASDITFHEPSTRDGTRCRSHGRSSTILYRTTTN